MFTSFRLQFTPWLQYCNVQPTNECRWARLYKCVRILERCPCAALAELSLTPTLSPRKCMGIMERFSCTTPCWDKLKAWLARIAPCSDLVLRQAHLSSSTSFQRNLLNPRQRFTAREGEMGGQELQMTPASHAHALFDFLPSFVSCYPQFYIHVVYFI